MGVIRDSRIESDFFMFCRKCKKWVAKKETKTHLGHRGIVCSICEAPPEKSKKPRFKRWRSQTIGDFVRVSSSRKEKPKEKRRRELQPQTAEPRIQDLIAEPSVQDSIAETAQVKSEQVISSREPEPPSEPYYKERFFEEWELEGTAQIRSVDQNYSKISILEGDLQDEVEDLREFTVTPSWQKWVSSAVRVSEIADYVYCPRSQWLRYWFKIPLHPRKIQAEMLLEEYCQGFRKSLGALQQVTLSTVLEAVLYTRHNIRMALERSLVLPNFPDTKLVWLPFVQEKILGVPLIVDCTNGKFPVIKYIHYRSSLPRTKFRPQEIIRGQLHLYGLRRIWNQKAQGIYEYRRWPEIPRKKMVLEYPIHLRRLAHKMQNIVPRVRVNIQRYNIPEIPSEVDFFQKCFGCHPYIKRYCPGDPNYRAIKHWSN